MKNIKEWLDERQLVYLILALFYRGELIRGLDILYNTDFLQKLLVCSDNNMLKSNTNKVIHEIANNKYNTSYMQLLQEDYEKLFLGPDHILAPLWESVYCSKDKIIFDETELVIRKLYNEFGLDVKKTEPADHLSLELAFMARLCVNTTLKTDEILVNQLKFLKEHLLEWVFPWEEKVNKSASTEFWINWAIITKTWLQNDFSKLEKNKIFK